MNHIKKYLLFESNSDPVIYNISDTDREFIDDQFLRLTDRYGIKDDKAQFITWDVKEDQIISRVETSYDTLDSKGRSQYDLYRLKGLDIKFNQYQSLAINLLFGKNRMSDISQVEKSVIAFMSILIKNDIMCFSWYPHPNNLRVHVYTKDAHPFQWEVCLASL